MVAGSKALAGFLGVVGCTVEIIFLGEEGDVLEVKEQEREGLWGWRWMNSSDGGGQCQVQD